jgi:hypothetical protein
MTLLRGKYEPFRKRRGATSPFGLEVAFDRILLSTPTMFRAFVRTAFSRWPSSTRCARRWAATRLYSAPRPACRTSAACSRACAASARSWRYTPMRTSQPPSAIPLKQVDSRSSTYGNRAGTEERSFAGDEVLRAISAGPRSAGLQARRSDTDAACVLQPRDKISTFPSLHSAPTATYGTKELGAGRPRGSDFESSDGRVTHV